MRGNLVQLEFSLMLPWTGQKTRMFLKSSGSSTLGQTRRTQCVTQERWMSTFFLIIWNMWQTKLPFGSAQLGLSTCMIGVIGHTTTLMEQFGCPKHWLRARTLSSEESKLILLTGASSAARFLCQNTMSSCLCTFTKIILPRHSSGSGKTQERKPATFTFSHPRVKIFLAGILTSLERSPEDKENQGNSILEIGCLCQKSGN